ncbi:hypothetical protein [Pseudomonas sp. GZD-209]|uniref:hypothetical protein n=1 Tax=Pseudomonas sp. GZD-209 TaxID=3404807 RepID=UPI003BB52B37
MFENKKSDVDSISISGFYYGILGVFLSAAGIALSVYALSSGEKSLWLGLSGWIAAILIGIFLTRLCLKLIAINSNIQAEAKESIQKSIELAARIGELEYANERLTEIGSFVISATAKGPAKPRRSTPMAPRRKSNSERQNQSIENEEVTDDI